MSFFGFLGYLISTIWTALGTWTLSGYVVRDVLVGAFFLSMLFSLIRGASGTILSKASAVYEKKEKEKGEITLDLWHNWHS